MYDIHLAGDPGTAQAACDALIAAGFDIWAISQSDGWIEIRGSEDIDAAAETVKPFGWRLIQHGCVIGEAVACELPAVLAFPLCWN